MGTNYYLYPAGEPHCSSCSCFERLHIGKSSGGWCFTLHVIPEAGINSLDDWKREMTKPGGVIKNEYGDTKTVAEVLEVITERSWGAPQHGRGTPHGYASWAQFYEQNHAQPGPNNLMRHRLGPHCVGHGEGTWDLVPGEFS